LSALRTEEKLQEDKSRKNPRSIEMDILRSKILTTGRKYEQFTAELLEELQSEIDMSKSMVNLFLKELETARN
jgi:hypothetical protein